MALRPLFLVLAGALALGGCASSSDDTPVVGAPPSLSAVPSAVSTAPSASVSVQPPASAAVGTTTLTGELVEGVEAGCWLLRTDGPSYLLIGGDRAVMQAGKRVTVVGAPKPELMTTCQQGTPFQVTSIRPA